MTTLTYKYRIKDSQHLNWLRNMAKKVNWCWNATQDFSLLHKGTEGKYPSYKILEKNIKNIKIEGLLSHTVRRVAKQYEQSRRQFKKHKLHWRCSGGPRRSLGWVPCANESLKIDLDTGDFKFCKRKFKCWYSRKATGKYLCSSLNEDARGRWYVNIVCSQVPLVQSTGVREIGIDLGCKNQIVCSDGVKYVRPNIYRRYEEKLAMAQRANKKRLVRTLSSKIANQRKDWSHKTTTEICRTARYVVVGDIEAKKLMKTRMAKSISDAGMHQIKSQLEYKAIGHGVICEKVSEKSSTVTCSCCLQKTGPSGLSALGVRYWACSECGTSHDRDVNAAVNILVSLQGIAGHAKGISVL